MLIQEHFQTRNILVLSYYLHHQLAILMELGIAGKGSITVDFVLDDTFDATTGGDFGRSFKILQYNTTYSASSHTMENNTQNPNKRVDYTWSRSSKLAPASNNNLTTSA